MDEPLEDSIAGHAGMIGEYDLHKNYQSNAWYTRSRYYHNGYVSWQFLCYGKPSCFFLQNEYLEIKVY